MEAGGLSVSMPSLMRSSRRTFLTTLSALVALGAKRKLSGTIGLEIYSLRAEAERDLPATLARIRKLGISEVEVPGLYGRRAAEFRKLLDDADLKATSMMADHAVVGEKITSVADDAHTLGVEHVVCSTIPHKQKHLIAEDCNRAVEDFNRWGEKLARSGLRFCYHTHGVEFDPSPDGTLFDTLVKHTDSKFVNFEMDMFWIVFAHQDPVKLLYKYPGRFLLMHIKDIR